MSDNESLFGQFTAVTAKDWMDKIVADLKGDDFNRRLVWKTDEGFEVMPFYRREDILDLPYLDSKPGSEPFVRGNDSAGNHWLIRQDIDVADFSAANRKALDILMKGVDSLGFIINNPDEINSENLEKLLAGIHLESVEINFRSAGKAIELLGIFKEFVRKSGTDPEKIRLTIEADPLSRLMQNGTLCINLEAGLDYLADLLKESGTYPLMRTVQVNASNFSNSGTGTVKELAFAIAMGNEYMSALTDRGISPDLAAGKIRFSFGTGSNYFFEIARLRAARILWSVITSRYGCADPKSRRMEIHSVTSTWNKTIYDPYVNLLRSQTEAMSAALGGANSITVEPFDKITGSTTDFSERIARNQQLLLREEAYFDKVADPSGGSYYIEKLTSMIADNSWKLFLEIEKSGGFASALKSGMIQKEIKDSASKRLKNISGRKETLLGTNQFPDYNEKKTGPSVRHFVNQTPSASDDGTKIEIEPIFRGRGAEEIEKIRLATDSAIKTPVVFMLTIGNPSMRRARSQFSCSFFGCGGFKVIDNPGFKTVEEGVKAAFDASADIIVICSSDEEYSELAPAAGKMISGRAIFVVAGNPPCSEELKAKGINHFISIRSDLVDSLTTFQKLVGMKF